MWELARQSWGLGPLRLCFDGGSNTCVAVEGCLQRATSRLRCAQSAPQWFVGGVMAGDRSPGVLAWSVKLRCRQMFVMRPPSLSLCVAPSRK